MLTKIEKYCSCGRSFTSEEIETLNPTPWQDISQEFLTCVFNCPGCGSSMLVDRPWPAQSYQTFLATFEMEPITFQMIKGRIYMNHHTKRYPIEDIEAGGVEGLVMICERAREFFRIK